MNRSLTRPLNLAEAHIWRQQYNEFVDIQLARIRRAPVSRRFDELVADQSAAAAIFRFRVR